MSNPNPIRALVTGANGFMGSHMVALLCRPRSPGSPDRQVVATDLGPGPSPAITACDITYAQCDIRDAGCVDGLFFEHGPFDHVYHLAARCDTGAGYADLFDVNVRGTINVIHALAARSPVVERMVLWGAADSGELTTKYCAEITALQLGRAHGVPVTIVRPNGAYGPRGRNGLARLIMAAARGGLGPFPFGSTRARAGTVHAMDVCRAAEFLAQHPAAAGEIYNVNDGSSYTVRELVRACARLAGATMLPIAAPFGLLKPAAAKLLALDPLVDASALKKLGWRPEYPDALEGLRETIAWYEQEGWL